MCGCLLQAPSWAPSPQPRHVLQIGDRTSGPSVHRPALNPPSHTSQGYQFIFQLQFTLNTNMYQLQVYSTLSLILESSPQISYPTSRNFTTPLFFFFLVSSWLRVSLLPPRRTSTSGNISENIIFKNMVGMEVHSSDLPLREPAPGSQVTNSLQPPNFVSIVAASDWTQ